MARFIGTFTLFSGTCLHFSFIGWNLTLLSNHKVEGACAAVAFTPPPTCGVRLANRDRRLKVSSLLSPRPRLRYPMFYHYYSAQILTRASGIIDLAREDSIDLTVSMRLKTPKFSKFAQTPVPGYLRNFKNCSPVATQIFSSELRG